MAHWSPFFFVERRQPVIQLEGMHKQRSSGNGVRKEPEVVQSRKDKEKCDNTITTLALKKSQIAIVRMGAKPLEQADHHRSLHLSCRSAMCFPNVDLTNTQPCLVQREVVK